MKFILTFLVLCVIFSIATGQVGKKTPKAKEIPKNNEEAEYIRKEIVREPEPAVDQEEVPQPEPVKEVEAPAPVLNKVEELIPGYVGATRNGVRHGFGKQTWSDKTTYEGEWENDKRHGHGLLITAPSAGSVRYEGGWKNDMRHGKGVLTLLNDPVFRYDGEFALDMKTGHGEYTTSDGSHYNGEFLEDARHGSGVLKTKAGTKYTGEWVNDMYHGLGVLTLADGSEYDGAFERGEKHGKGTMKHADGRVESGYYKHGARKDHDEL